MVGFDENEEEPVMGHGASRPDALEAAGQLFVPVRPEEAGDIPQWALAGDPVLMEQQGDQLLRRLPPRGRDALRYLVTWLREHRIEAGDAVASYCLSVEPELRRHPSDHAITQATAIANFDQIIWGLENEVESRAVPAPPEAVSIARRYARRRTSLRTVQRAYHLGHSWLWHQWSDLLGRRLTDPHELRVTLAGLSWFMFVYIDNVAAAVADEYIAETVRWQRGVEARTLQVVRSILGGEKAGSDSPSEISWKFDGDNLGIVAWASTREAEAGLHDYARSLGSRLYANVLDVWPEDQASLWIWLDRHPTPDASTNHHLTPPNNVRAAIGEPASGIEGFRRTHQQATLARDVANLNTHSERQLWFYRDHRLAILATADAENARRFVYEQLGRLVEPDASTAGLRESLQVYLNSDMNGVRAAHELHVHRNTLAYRLDRAAELRGISLDKDRVELEVALNLFAQIGEPAKSDAHRYGQTR